MWNHPQPNAQAVKKAEPKKVRGIFAGLIVIAVAGIAVVLVMMSGSSEPAKKDGKRKESAKIREVTPAPAPKAKPEEAVQMVTNRFGKVVPKKKAETYKDERGVLRYKVGNGRVPDPDAHKYLVKSSTVFTDGLPKFTHRSESEIAMLLSLKPGDMVFGDLPHDDKFKQDFVESLLDPIQILPEDSEADKKLKMEVEACKKELAERVKDGEDLGQILQETRDEYRRLANFKHEMEEMVRKEVAENAQSTTDVDTYFEAMNKMLESKGIEAVKMTKLMRRKLGYDLMKQAEAKAGAEKGTQE